MRQFIKKLIPRLVIYRIRRLIGTGSEINLDDYYLLEKSKITYAHDLLFTYHNTGFMEDPLFIESYALGKKTDQDLLLKDYEIYWRIHVLCWAASHAALLEGDFVDCGVNTGIFARAIINYVGFENLDKTYYLLDTFEGMAEEYSSAGEMERHRLMNYGQKKGLYEQVKETFKGFKVKIIKGAVPATLVEVDTPKVAFLSIDMNCVEPEVRALEFFWDKMVSGGMIVLDDYGYADAHTEQRLAHNEFAKSKGVSILILPTCQGVIIKP